MNVLGFAGSLRKESYNRKLLNCAKTTATQLGHDIEIFDLLDIPLYNEDVEQAGIPEPVQRFRERLTWADAIVIASPEYNNSMSGVLKNAIDWASRPPNKLAGKTACIMGATIGNFGTVLSQAHLRQVLLILNVILVPTPFVYIPRAQDSFDASGNLTNEIASKALRAVLERLFEITQALRKDA
jgi:chromate reductase